MRAARAPLLSLHNPGPVMWRALLAGCMLNCAGCKISSGSAGCESTLHEKEPASGYNSKTVTCRAQCGVLYAVRTVPRFARPSLACRLTTYRHRFARAAPAPRAKNRGRASPVNSLARCREAAAPRAKLLPCQASKTAFRSRCARPGARRSVRGVLSEYPAVLSEYPAARARASYWFDKLLPHRGTYFR